MNQQQRLAHKTASRKRRVRLSVRGTNERPRLHVFRSNQHIYAQIINDDTGITLTAADDTKSSGTKTEKATAVGQQIAALAKKKKVTKVAFDRGAYRYHGRVKALAEAARAAGLEF